MDFLSVYYVIYCSQRSFVFMFFWHLFSVPFFCFLLCLLFFLSFSFFVTRIQRDLLQSTHSMPNFGHATQTVQIGMTNLMCKEKKWMKKQKTKKRSFAKLTMEYKLMSTTIFTYPVNILFLLVYRKVHWRAAIDFLHLICNYKQILQ